VTAIRILLKYILFAFLCIFSITVNAQVNNAGSAKKDVADTIKKDFFTAPDTVKKLHSNPLSLLPPAIAIGYGVSSFVFQPVRRIDYYFYGVTQRTDADFHTRAESYFEFAPIAVVYGLDLAGVPGKNTFIDQTALLGLSAGIFGVTGYITKYSTHRLRPNGADYLSSPSAHTATAFIGAEFLAQEYSEKSPVYTVIGYSIAVTTGIFRMYNRDHWFSDVVAGAGFGILSTKASYLIYPYIRNWLTHKDKHGRSTMIMPTYQNGTVELAFAKEL
jgi:membrane-associated phospholipid phosphatase